MPQHTLDYILDSVGKTSYTGSKCRLAGDGSSSISGEKGRSLSEADGKAYDMNQRIESSASKNLWRAILTLLVALPSGAIAQMKPEIITGSHVGIPLDATSNALLAEGITLPVNIPHRCEHHIYPRRDTLLNHTGFPVPTILNYRIATDGSVKDIVVQQSSGSFDLDKIATVCAAQFRYTPAMKGGMPIEIAWKFEINWD